MKILTRIRTGVRNLFKRTGTGGFSSRRGGSVDAGRDAFIKLKTSEGKKKRSLLRKLNNYRTRKTNTGRQSYQAPPESSRWGRRLLLVLCLTLAIGLFIKFSGGESVKTFLADLDYFNITTVEVNGCRKTSAAQVRGDSGVAINSSLLFLDGNRVSETIKAQVPWAKNVDVIKKWPDKVIIHIQEYEPQALVVKEVDGLPQLYYMDGDGEPFIRAEVGMDIDFPVITGLNQIEDQSHRAERLSEALYFLKLIRANNPNLPAQSVSEIHVDLKEGLVIHMVEYPFPVFFGSGEVRKKYVRLRKVLEILYKPRKKGMEIAQVTYIRMNYLNDKVIVGYSESG